MQAYILEHVNISVKISKFCIFIKLLFHSCPKYCYALVLYICYDFSVSNIMHYFGILK